VTTCVLPPSGRPLLPVRPICFGARESARWKPNDLILIKTVSYIFIKNTGPNVCHVKEAFDYTGEEIRHISLYHCIMCISMLN